MKLQAEMVKQRARSYYGSLPPPLRRASVLLLGMAVLAAGLVMLVLPGPGLLVMAFAIAVLALEFDWAKGLAERASVVSKALLRRLHHSR